MTLQRPFCCGLCGSSGVSHLAWCLRWTAAHSSALIPVLIHSQMRKNFANAGWNTAARWAIERCKYSVTDKIVTCVINNMAPKDNQKPAPKAPPSIGCDIQVSAKKGPSGPQTSLLYRRRPRRREKKDELRAVKPKKKPKKPRLRPDGRMRGAGGKEKR